MTSSEIAHNYDSEVMAMTGRNNEPKNDGPASSPSRLDQFGGTMVQEDKQASKEIQPKTNPSC